MVDLLSITASVAGITMAALQSAQFLVKTIENIKDAPSTIKELTADIGVVESVLYQLIANVQGQSEEIIGNNQIGPAVENCDRACKAFQLQVERWMKHSNNNKLFWIIQWKIGLFGQERINTFKGQLQNCKSTLNIALTTANLYVSPHARPILLGANLLSRLVVINNKDLVKVHKDSILEANRADFEQELARASTEMVHIEQNLRRHAVIGSSTDQSDESEQSRLELLQELQRQQAANALLHSMCEEAISQTINQHSGQNIKRVTATNDGVALTGIFNVPPGEHSRIRQDISDVNADTKGFVIAGWANDVNINDMRR